MSWVLGSGAEPVSAELVLEPVDFCLLMGGRVDPAEVPRESPAARAPHSGS